MVEQAGALPGEAETSLADSRAQFVASLGRRLDALRQALSALEEAPRSSAHRDHLRRRIHAFGAAAGVLGFERVFETFKEAEGVLGRAGSAGALGPAELGLVARALDLVPSLVLGADVPLGTARGRIAAPERKGGWPTSVLVFGGEALVDSLIEASGNAGTAFDCERTEDVERATQLASFLSPDVAVIDADRVGARELVETLVNDPLLDPVRIVVVGTFDRPEAAAGLVAFGALRVLPKPASPETLRRSIAEVARERAQPAPRIDPIGDVSIEALSDRVALEIRRGLVDGIRAQSRGATVPLGEGTDVLAAVWASVARIRELVTLRSGGSVRFESHGPEGAIPFAPWMADERTRATLSGERRGGEDVVLSGRKVLVADDDPAVAWFLSGLLRAAGADVSEALDGNEALEIVRREWPEVVVTDILMPGLDGFSLCREIKRDIALSDVPVILLSWKEDLLQRVRELGVEAEGYLRKEASASTVVQRVREVLLPRSRIETRIGAGGEARGRLDGLTPRLILDIVCRRGQNAHISIRDAAFLYEVDVRGGRLRGVSRTSLLGRSERGESVLAAMLGVRAGRFVVRHDDRDVAGEMDVALRDAIQGPVERARAAMTVLTRPANVARVDVDTAALEPYLTATPQALRSVVQRLAEGASPDDIVRGGIPSRVVESVLSDLVLHAGVRGVFGKGGEDLVAIEKKRPIPVRTPSGAFRAPPSPADLAARLGATPAPAEAAAPEPSAPAPVAGATPPTPSPSAAAAPGPDEMEFRGLLGDSLIPPAPVAEEPAGEPTSRSGSYKALAPPTSAPREPSPFEAALRALPDDLAASPRPPEPAKEASPAVPRVGAPRLPRPTDRSPAALARAALAEDGVKREETPSFELGSAVASFGSASADPPPVAEVAPSAEPPRATGDSASPSPKPLLELLDEDVGPLPPVIARGALPLGDSSGGTGKGEPSTATVPRRQRDTLPPSRQKPVQSKGAPDENGASGGWVAALAVAVIAAAAVYALVSALRGPVPQRVPAQPADEVRAREKAAPSVVAPLPEPSAAAAPSAAPVVAPPPEPADGVTVGEDLALPPKVILQPDRGLIEIDAGAPHKVFVDGVFLGPGPLRQLPLRPGQHEVRIQGTGVDVVRSVFVQANRRTRVALSPVK